MDLRPFNFHRAIYTIHIKAGLVITAIQKKKISKLICINVDNTTQKTVQYGENIVINIRIVIDMKRR